VNLPVLVKSGLECLTQFGISTALALALGVPVRLHPQGMAEPHACATTHAWCQLQP